jgi:hypothetical protein
MKQLAKCTSSTTESKSFGNLRSDEKNTIESALSLPEAGWSNSRSILAQILQKLPDNPDFCHQFLTAADAKIPLSVVQVKYEPQ